MKTNRTAREVLDSHLRLARSGDVETDLKTNFSEDVVLLTSFGIYRGAQGLREKADLLARQMPNGRWTYHNVITEGELGFLEWTGEAENGARIEDGADSYLIRDGRICGMTIHYTVLPPP